MTVGDIVFLFSACKTTAQVEAVIAMPVYALIQVEWPELVILEDQIREAARGVIPDDGMDMPRWVFHPHPMGTAWAKAVVLCNEDPEAYAEMCKSYGLEESYFDD